MLFLTAILALLSVTGTCGAIGIGTGTGSIFEELRGGVPNEWAFSRVPRPGESLFCVGQFGFPILLGQDFM